MSDFVSVLTDNADLFVQFFWTTVKLFVIGGVGALVLGVVLAALRVSPVPAMRAFGSGYVTILRNTPLKRPSVLTPKSLRRILQITEGITANIFHMVNSLAIDAIGNGSEQITNEAVESWEPEFEAEAAFA